MRKKLHFRYWLSFIILIVLLLVFIFWNINSGSISISLKDIFQILFHKNGDETAYNIVWEIRLPRILAAVILGGALSVSGFLLQTFFWKPRSQVLLYLVFHQVQTDRGIDNDLSAGKIHGSYFRTDDPGCVYRISDIHGICAFDLAKGKADVHACCKRYHDWIYLFCNNRFCGHFCR